MRRSLSAIACALAVATLVALAAPAAATAATLPSLRSSRTCAYVGTEVRLTVAIPASLLATPAQPARAELVTYRPFQGVWRQTSVRRVTDEVTRASLRLVIRPKRGRYRYAVRIRSRAGTTESNAVDLMIVGKNVVALTFDDGPWPGSTANILGTLRQKDVRATFFMCGSTLAAYPSLGRPVASAAHEIGNHTYTHPVLTGLSDYGIQQELTRTQNLVKSVLGVTPKVCRPPYGATSTRVRGVIERMGMSQTLWNVDPEDWRRPGASAVAERVVSATRPGYVVLMHDGGGDRSGTAAAVPAVIDRLRAQGYDFVTVSELNALKAGR